MHALQTRASQGWGAIYLIAVQTIRALKGRNNTAQGVAGDLVIWFLAPPGADMLSVPIMIHKSRYTYPLVLHIFLHKMDLFIPARKLFIFNLDDKSH